MFDLLALFVCDCIILLVCTSLRSLPYERLKSLVKVSEAFDLRKKTWLGKVSG